MSIRLLPILQVRDDEPSGRCLVCNGWVRRHPKGGWYHVNPLKNDHPAVGPY